MESLVAVVAVPVVLILFPWRLIVAMPRLLTAWNSATGSKHWYSRLALLSVLATVILVIRTIWITSDQHFFVWFHEMRFPFYSYLLFEFFQMNIEESRGEDR